MRIYAVAGRRDSGAGRNRHRSYNLGRTLELTGMDGCHSRARCSPAATTDAMSSSRCLRKAFEYQSRHYGSLRAIAHVVTGTLWNGLLFFGLTERRPG
jgi:hypothetical protein